MRNRKNLPVNQEEFGKVKELLNRFNAPETQRIMESLGNERSVSTVYLIERSEDLDDYKERVRRKYEKRKSRENGDESEERTGAEIETGVEEITVNEALSRSISFLKATARMLESIKDKIDSNE